MHTETDINPKKPTRFVDEGISSVNKSNCHLSVLTTETHSICAVLNLTDSTYIAIEQIDTLNHELLKGQYKSTSVAIETDRFTIVPESLFEPEKAQSLLDFNFVDDSKSKVIHDYQQDMGCYTIFSSTEKRIASITDSLPNAKIMHHNTPLLHCWGNANKHNTNPQLLLNLRESSFDLIIVKSGDLQFCNSFLHQSIEDVAYYLLSVYDQLDLNPSRTPIHLSGMATPNSELIQLLKSYIKEVHLVKQIQNFSYSSALDKATPHHYYNLFAQYLAL